MQEDFIRVRGARQHNLKNIDVDIPRGKLVVITGLSGSGKSTLAFDTIFAEGQRRYVESLSAYARQFLGQLDKPDVDSIDGLSPAIAIDQKGLNRNPRSTVGTITEIYDYLRLLFARVGQPHCPIDGQPLQRQSAQQIVDALLGLADGTRLLLLAPVIRERKGEHQRVLDEARRAGFVRVRVDGQVYDLDETIPLEKNKAHTIEVVVDRLVIRHTGVGDRGSGVSDHPDRVRIADSVDTALKVGAGVLQVQIVGGEELTFSQQYACSVHGPINLGSLEPRDFSFNNPSGACPSCNGLGLVQEVDPERVIPDSSISLADGAIVPWSQASRAQRRSSNRQLAALAEHMGFSLDSPVRELPAEALSAILYGSSGDPIPPGSGDAQGQAEPFEGVIPGLRRRIVAGLSDEERTFLDPFLSPRQCPACMGMRLRPEVLAVTVDGYNIAQIAAMSITEAFEWASRGQGSGVGDQGSGIRGHEIGRAEAGSQQQGNRGTREQGNRGTGEQGNRGTGEQGNRGTGEQGNRRAGEQASRGTADAKHVGLKQDTRAHANDIAVHLLQSQADEGTGERGQGPGEPENTADQALLSGMPGSAQAAQLSDGREGIPSAASALSQENADVQSEHSIVQTQHMAQTKSVQTQHIAQTQHMAQTKSVQTQHIAQTQDIASLHSTFNIQHSTLIAAPILKEIRSRLSFLLDVGLSYLSLDRSATTLSGGEAQRIRLATQIGSGLSGVLYILDEPSIGLHPRDHARLMETIKNLRRLGNSVLVVEHDEESMRAADWLIDIGPLAGVHGGQLIASGTIQDIMSTSASITGQFLSGKRRIPVPKRRRSGSGRKLQIKGAREHNLKNIDVTIPLGTLTVVTGVSGSGKSSLINDTLYAVLAQKLYGAHERPGAHDTILGIEQIDKVIAIDQAAIGRTPRSNPATYTKLFDPIRNLFAQVNEAKARGYDAGRFSFNVAGGRCEHCHGEGLMQIEMQFLPDLYVVCEVCNGTRYNRETLDIRYRSKNIAEVLAMTVEEALAFFERIPAIREKLQALNDVGLGYMHLDQAATTLSGGEAQRIKLATELARRSTGRTLYILDEPTTGLHFADVEQLLAVLQRLVDAGNTVLVIEHHLDMIKSADWLIDMGPEGGDAGGLVVAVGTPEQLVQYEDSYTSQFLRTVLGRET